MSRKPSQLHIFFFPYMAHGRMMPAVDMANLFASRGCKATIILTPVNATSFTKAIERSRNLGLEIDVLVVKFPAVEVGLPEGCEVIRLASTVEMVKKFFTAMSMLEQPLQKLIAEHRPDCLVADSFFPWTTQLAAKFGIPRQVFHGHNVFASCASICLMTHEPHKKVSSDTEPFVVFDISQHEIKLTRDQLPYYMKEESDLTNFYRKIQESELASYGVVVNSFYELEPAYADHYRRVLGRKAWHIGPTCLLYKDKEDKAQRGADSSVDYDKCQNWLRLKQPNSVVYVSFGSASNFNDEKLMEIALGLEASGKQFIWVVRKLDKREGFKEEWLPKGFEKRIEGRGLIIRGWAPQVVILEHEAVGGFVTHCGWNSISEAICAGVTWPVSSEQFYNEKFVTQVLGIGVGVGVKKWVRHVGDNSVKREAIEKAVKKIMEGEEAEEMRSKASELREMASRAFEEGGSSYSDLNALFEDLRLRRNA